MKIPGVTSVRYVPDPDYEVWTYRRLTLGPVSRKVDAETKLYFRLGRVFRIVHVP
jgi:hypothetical protein